MKFEYQEKIDNYVQDRMSENEIKDFEQELSQKKELLDQLKYTKAIKQSIISREEKMAKLREWESEDQIQEPVKFPATGTESSDKPIYERRNLWYWISGIAAVLVVGFFIVSPLYMFYGESEGPVKFQKNEDSRKPSPSFEQINECDSIESDSIINIMEKQ